MGIGATGTGSASAQQPTTVYSDVPDGPGMKHAMDVLNWDLALISPAVVVVHCDMMIEHGLTHYEVVFAGVCQNASKKTVQVCGDTIAGWFALSEWTGPVTPQRRNDLVRFTDRDCPGGG